MFDFRKMAVMPLAILLAAFPLFAQVSADPNDVFYDNAQRWELHGLTERPLPQLRPYPLPVIKGILEYVIENGGEYDSALAKEEFERIFSRPWKVGMDVEVGAKRAEERKDDEKDSSVNRYAFAAPRVAGDIPFNNLVGFGYSVGFYAVTDSDYENYLPYAQYILHDSIYDASTVSKLSVYSDWNTQLSFGNESVYAATGISRVGFGPFRRQGLALNEASYHATNMSFNATMGNFSFAQVFESIGATNNLNSEDYDNLSSGKFLSFHSLQFCARDWLSVSYYENIVFGPGFNLLYTIPAPMMAVQNIGGADANLQMGLLLKVTPVDGLVWATDLFVDDYSVNDFVKLNFDAKYRFALQSGVVYYPLLSAMKSFSANYTCVMPYVYSHWEYDANTNGPVSGSSMNYQNYTNNGMSIGSSLDPNSDAVTFRATLRPHKLVTLDLSTSLIRHANSAEAFDEEDAARYVLADAGRYVTNGTSFMHQMFSGKTSGEHVNQAWDCLGFMTSDHKMYVAQAGISAQLDLPRTRGGKFSLTLGYSFEYIRNAGVNENVYTGGKLDGFTDNLDGTYTYNGTKYKIEEIASLDEVAAEVSRQKQAWIDQLHDEVNHYFSVGVKYEY